MEQNRIKYILPFLIVIFPLIVCVQLFAGSIKDSESASHSDTASGYDMEAVVINPDEWRIVVTVEITAENRRVLGNIALLD